MGPDATLEELKLRFCTQFIGMNVEREKCINNREKGKLSTPQVCGKERLSVSRVTSDASWIRAIEPDIERQVMLNLRTWRESVLV